MHSQHQRTLQAFRRAQGWLGARPELTAVQGASPAQTTPLAQHVAALGAVVQEITTHASQQELHGRAAKGSTAESRRLRTELLVHQM